MDINVNQAAINGAIERAFDKTVAAIGVEFNKQITASVWPWPRGESPRDIVDTGALRDSQQCEVSGFTATYSWPVKYSLYVHEGAVLNNGTVLPPRRWTVRALSAAPPMVIFATMVAEEIR